MGRRAASRRSIFGCFRMVCQFNDDPSPPHRICHACARARGVVAGGGEGIGFAWRLSGRGGGLFGAPVVGFANDSEAKASKSGLSAFALSRSFCFDPTAPKRGHLSALMTIAEAAVTFCCWTAADRSFVVRTHGDSEQPSEADHRPTPLQRGHPRA